MKRDSEKPLNLTKIPEEIFLDIFELAHAHDLVELSVKTPEGKFTIRRPGRSRVEHAAPEQIPHAEIEENVEKSREGLANVFSPLMGIFFRAAAPGLEPFAGVGQRVEVGDTLCIIEAMKVMNEITSEVAGVIEEIIPKNGEVVEEGAILFLIRPEAGQ